MVGNMSEGKRKMKKTGSSGGGNAGDDAFKLKPNACEACYKSRVKCVYPERTSATAGVSGLRCIRCEKKNKDCQPRVVIRGRIVKQEKQKQKQLEGREGWSAVDVNAFKSIAIFNEHAHLAVHYNSAAAMLKTFKSLGLEEAPPTLRGLCHGLFLAAKREKSLSRLHAATTLAVSSNIRLDMDLLESERHPFTKEQCDKLQQMVHTRFLVNNEAGPCFIIHHDKGKKLVIANRQYEFLFEKASAMVSDLSETPHFKLWKKFAGNVQVADEFSSKVIQKWLLCGNPVGDPPACHWEVTEPNVDIVDKDGNPYLCTLYETGYMAAEGFIFYLVMAFKDLRPKNAFAQQKLEEWNAVERGMQAPYGHDSKSMPNAMTLVPQPLNMYGAPPVMNGGGIQQPTMMAVQSQQQFMQQPSQPQNPSRPMANNSSLYGALQMQQTQQQDPQQHRSIQRQLSGDSISSSMSNQMQQQQQQQQQQDSEFVWDPNFVNFNDAEFQRTVTSVFDGLVDTENERWQL